MNNVPKYAHVPVILIVDDNPQNLQVLGKQLQENQYEIEFAISGEATLEWLDIKQFDLILLDINMPGMSGFDVCKKIRANQEMNKMPVIFLSAEAERESILKGFELGGQDYITKPFDSRELIVRVRTHLALKDSLEKLEKLNRSLEKIVQERTQQLKEANDKLEATNARLVDLDKSKSEFLNLISHEIRTPLNGIIGPLELLKGPVNVNEIGDLIGILDKSVKRLEQFALDALLITRLKTKEREIKNEKVSLSGLINEALSAGKNRIRSKNITINFDNDPDNDIVSGECSLLKKCIFNILDNAIVFSPRNGYVRIKICKKDNYTVCEIHDQGKGFSPDNMEHLFELFSPGKEYKDSMAGINLPIVKMIMDAHGGEIILENLPEGGARVILLFPDSP
jgi:two-component system sensor histidine kinase/response regulator